MFKGRKTFAEAEPLILDSYRAYKAKLGANHRNPIETAERLKSLYVAWGKIAEVTRLQ
jgi:hypothetical protein